MVDMHSHKIIDMIESREFEDVKVWLAEYPNIRIVSRDGSRIYARAITEALPQAIQISDRFHLLKNLTDYARIALQKLFQGRISIPITDETHQRRVIMLIGTIAQRINLVKELHKNGHTQEEIRLIVGASEQIVKKYIDIRENDIPVEKITTRGREHIEAVEKLRQRAALVRSLKSEGYCDRIISQKTGFTAKTIKNYLSDTFSPINAHYGKQREGKLEPFRDEVMRLKLDGLKYREIHLIIKEKGYTGTQDAIRGFFLKERRIHQDLLATGAGTQELIDKKWLIRLLYKPIDKIKGIISSQLEYILSAYPLYADILGIVNEFRKILKSKKSKSLLSWLEKVNSLGIAELNSFVEGVKMDIDAVMNAIEYDYSNGLAEGTINKIKVIKRIMFGRCHFQLLKNKCVMLSRY
jgi:transposase